MRLHSTKESIRNGETSLLAVIETLVIVGFWLWPVWRHGTITHIALSACIAPFALMRTKEATETTWNFLEQITNKIFGDGGKAFVPLHAVGIALARPTAVLLHTIKSPLKALRAIPTNWATAVFVTDFLQDPDFIPDRHELEEKRPQSVLVGEHKLPPLIEFLKGIPLRKLTPRELFGVFFVAIFFLLPMYLPAIAYRISVKSTALFALPLLWLVDTSLSDKSLINRIESLRDKPIEKLARCYGAGVLIFCAILPAIFHAAFTTAVKFVAANLHPVLAFIITGYYIHPDGQITTDWWHIARIVSAILTFVILLYLSSALHARRHDPNYQPTENVLEVLLLMRGISTLYVLGVTLLVLLPALPWQQYLQRIVIKPWPTP